MEQAIVLRTKQLTLEPPVPDNAVFLRKLGCDPVVRRYLGGPSQDATGPLRASPPDIYWIVSLTHNSAPIGLMSLTAHKDGQDTELSYQFMPSSWGYGFAFEACSAALDHAKGTLNLPRVIAETQVANSQSIALLTRLGLREMQQITRFGAVQAIYSTVP